MMARGDELIPWEAEHPRTPSELLTTQFYDWERRGRGWELYAHPVPLEPPFRLFFGHSVASQPPVDDARKHTLLSAFAEGIRSMWSATPTTGTRSVDHIPDLDEVDPIPEWFSPEEPLRELAVVLPPAGAVSRESAEQFLLGLRYALYPVGFEIIGQADSISVQFVCREPDLGQLEQQLVAYFPDVVRRTDQPTLPELWRHAPGREIVMVDFGLSREFMLPLKTFRNFTVDPLIGLTGALAEIRDGEVAIMQVLFQAVRYPWADSIMRAVTDWEGKPFFADAPNLAAQTKTKISRPLFAVAVRACAASPGPGRAWQIVRAIGGALSQFEEPVGNEFIPLSNDGYPDLDHEDDVLRRLAHRSGMILNSEELVSLVHLPSSSVRTEKLRRAETRTKTAPASVLGHRLVLGLNEHAGKTTRVTLSPEHRIRHTYVIGASGTGKSTLLLNLIVQDIANGEGIGVLDPHGDLVDQILSYIPEDRLEDVILVDPSDEAFPVGFNILSAHSDVEKTLLASDLVSVFRRLSTSWGDQMTSVLGNAILAFLESDRGGTLADLRRFLVEADFRRRFLETVQDHEVVYYWQREFPLLSGKPQAPLLTRLDSFLRPKLIRYMVGQKENRLDFRAIMDGRKIFLAKLAQGAIGEENAYLLGTLLVSKLHQTAMGRQDVPESERNDFYLYIDEFHNFVTPSMAAILSGVRKYRLGLVLAHQEFRQLWNRDNEVAAAVLANPSTRICFRLGDFDAQKLKEGFTAFDARDLQNLSVGEAVARVERAECDFNLRTLPPAKIDARVARSRRERVIALSRERYARPRADVERTLAREAPRPAAPPPARHRAPRPTAEPARVPSPPPEPARPAPRRRGPVRDPGDLGRGGLQHRYLQQLVKRLAQDRGFRAIIEKQLLGGVGSIDISLERDDRRIACEVSVSSTAEQELSNVQKCLAAGYDTVVVLSPDRKNLNKIRECISAKLRDEGLEKVFFFVPEEFLTYLDSLQAASPSKEETLRGYKVKTRYKALGAEEDKTRKRAISQVILRALKRLKE